jgi:hypothetical protein
MGRVWQRQRLRQRLRQQCCAQQTGMHILVVEALLIAIFLSEGRANTYRHRKYDRRIVLPVPSFSWSCLAESLPV